MFYIWGIIFFLKNLIKVKNCKFYFSFCCLSDSFSFFTVSICLCRESQVTCKSLFFFSAVSFLKRQGDIFSRGKHREKETECLLYYSSD